MSLRCVDPIVMCVPDLFPGDLRFPQRAEHYVGVLYLFGVGPLALEPAQGVVLGNAVSLCYP